LATYEPDWQSLVNHNTPQWLRDGKFGIYAHWGIYSVPACGPNGTWYAFNMYRPGNNQAELFLSSGARFAGPVAEHHDGFSMWDSQVNPWNAAKMGPKRDVTGELARACRERGMRFKVALHHAEEWWFYPHWRQDCDVSDPAFAGL